MTDKKISNFEFGTLNYFIVRAFLIGTTFNYLINVIKQDSWIIPLISVIPAIIIILFIDYVMKYRPELNLAEKTIELFSKKTGLFLLILLIMCILIFSLLNSLNMVNFVQSQFLNKTPLLYISIIFFITTFYIVNKGINVISRTSNILFYIGIILLILSFLGLIPVFKLDNLQPIFISPIKKYSNCLNFFYCFNILPMFLLCMVPKDCFNSPKIKKTLIISYIVAAISIFFIVFQTITVFGYELTKLYEYPEFFVLKHINLSARVESILIIQLIFDMLVFNILSVYFIGNSIKSILNIEKLNVVYFMICLLMIIGTNFLNKYNFYLENAIVNYVPIFLNTFITLLILIICFKIKIDKR